MSWNTLVSTCLSAGAKGCGASNLLAPDEGTPLLTLANPTNAPRTWKRSSGYLTRLCAGWGWAYPYEFVTGVCCSLGGPEFRQELYKRSETSREVMRGRSVCGAGVCRCGSLRRMLCNYIVAMRGGCHAHTACSRASAGRRNIQARVLASQGAGQLMLGKGQVMHGRGWVCNGPCNAEEW